MRAMRANAGMRSADNVIALDWAGTVSASVDRMSTGLSVQNELPVHTDFPETIKHHSFCRQSIPPRTSDFLIIALNIFGQVVMNDPPDVRLVDPHTKCDRRTYDLDPVKLKIFLH